MFPHFAEDMCENLQFVSLPTGGGGVLLTRTSKQSVGI